MSRGYHYTYVFASFAISGGKTGLFPIAARFNHACKPSNNVRYEYDEQRGVLRFIIAADGVLQGDELKIAYREDQCPELLYRHYGFRCCCGACDGLSDDDVASLKVKW